MSHKMPECLPALIRTLDEANPRADTYEDAYALRRIAMTLSRWSELECGVENGGVERDEKTGKTFWYSAVTGKRWPYPDKETGALRRLAAIMVKYPTLRAYVQGDPRGASLYILRPGDVPEGKVIPPTIRAESRSTSSLNFNI